METRLKEGLSGKEIENFSKRFLNRDFAGVYSMDNIDLQKIRDKLAAAKYFAAASCIVNTSEQNEKGEHWIAIHINNSGRAEYFDSYGLPPIQRGVKQLCYSLATEYDWNDQPVQDIMDQSSVACGYHALFYLYVKQCEPKMKLGDIVNNFYSINNLKLNDLFAVSFIENKLISQ